MRKLKYLVVGMAVLTLIGGSFAFASDNSNESLINKQSNTVAETETKADKADIVESETYESMENETHLLQEIKKVNLSYIEEKEDSVLIDHSSNVPAVDAEYYNKATQEEIFTSQSPNQLGNAEEYQSIIMNEWFVGDETSVVEETTINGHAAVVRHSDLGANALYVITNENVYTFADASYDTLRDLAEHLDYK
ncbi:hypothetical protein C772_02669 [Bhargavaea cecembensis DSE10]|uniref:DUF4367 domain-containing protein n=1 Tax=Bhargavaea cecembensis DSE10 TaxID=1235279 RepID=M7N9S2_9BACL|nr:hypothetical protein [Bhargavaea cecembensis]EMR05318.1 hypothetical protein C772_02669 [Bhargavaea cecembensis DSE10]